MGGRGVQEQYPGVVGAGLVFPASWAVSAVLGLARAALRPEERGLLVPLREEELPAALAARFDPDQAPRRRTPHPAPRARRRRATPGTERRGAARP